MTTQALIYALRYSLKLAHEAQMDHRPADAEELLQRTQFLWLRERPLVLRTNN